MKAVALGLVILIGCMVSPAFPQAPVTSAPVNKQAAPTKSEEDQKLEAILDELRQIRQLLADQNKYISQRAAAATVPAAPEVMEKVSLALGSGWYSMGSDAAPVTVMEFADFQCPYCRRFHTDSFAELKKNYIDTGKVRFISRDLPLEFHSNAMNAALAAHCAGEQNKYWELRNTLIVNSKDLARESITKYAQQDGLEMASFTACLDSQKYKSQIERDRDQANQLGFSGTPSFVIGRMKNDKLEGVKIVGAMPYATFDSKINDLLAAHD
jgi:protein-disulfide isomerase